MESQNTRKRRGKVKLANDNYCGSPAAFSRIFQKDKYRQRIAELAISGKNSVIIDFEELYGFDQALTERC